jgi:type VI secretion system protein ImpB
MKATELPFVVGVLADLSGQPKQALRPLKERKAVYIDRDNFNDVLTKAGPRLALRVPNTLTDPNSKLAVELNFKHIDDFEPAKVAEQIGPLKQLLDMRTELIQLLNRMEGNDKLEQLLESVLTNQQKAMAVGQYMDSKGQGLKAAAPVQSAPEETAAVEEEPVAEEEPVVEETPAIEETPEPEPVAAAEEPSPAPEPAESEAVDADLAALLSSMDESASPEEPAPAPAEGGEPKA